MNTSFFTILKTAIQLLPIIVDTIKSVEQAIPQPGQGAAKLTLVQNVLQAAYTGITDAEASFEQIWPTVKVMIDQLVGIYNAVGQFKKN